MFVISPKQSSAARLQREAADTQSKLTLALAAARHPAAGATNDDSDLVLPLLESPQTMNLIGGMPEFKQVAPPIEGPRATGLAAAFGKKAVEPEVEETPNLPAKRGRGRPPKPAEEAQFKTEGKGAVDTPEEPTEGEEAQWQEPQDDDLNNMMNEVLGPKLGKMMPDKH